MRHLHLVTFLFFPIALFPAAHSASIPKTIRAAAPADIVGAWQLSPEQPPSAPSECPTTITHLSTDRIRQGPLRLPHTAILHESIACSDPSEPPRQRLFRFYTRTAVHRNLTIPGSTFRPPPLLLKLLNITSPARKIRGAAERLGEPYFIGLEAVDRVCNGTTVFERGTVAYVLRPVKRTFEVRSIGVRLTTGASWLVMIPFRKKPCVYRSQPTRANATSVEVTGETQSATQAAEGEQVGGGQTASENDLEARPRDGSECFPANATVVTEVGELREMRALKVGDRVAVGDGVFSEVFMFTHRDEKVKAEFIWLQTESGERVGLTAGHYLYVNGELRVVETVRTGEWVELSDGSTSRVVAVSRTVERGLYNPQTLHGDIIVNGVRVSTYTRAVEPCLAHVVLSPLRCLYRIFNKDWSFGLLGEGMRWPRRSWRDGGKQKGFIEPSVRYSEL